MASLRGHVGGRHAPYVMVLDARFVTISTGSLLDTDDRRFLEFYKIYILYIPLIMGDEHANTLTHTQSNTFAYLSLASYIGAHI